MPDQPMYRSQVLDHLGLVAGMFDELRAYKKIGSRFGRSAHRAGA